MPFGRYHSADGMPSSWGSQHGPETGDRLSESGRGWGLDGRGRPVSPGWSISYERRRPHYPNARASRATRTAVAVEHDAPRSRGARRADRRDRGIHRDDDRPAVVAPALQPAGNVPGCVGRAVQRDAHRRRPARRAVCRPRAPRSAAPRQDRGPARIGRRGAGVPHDDRREPLARRVRAAQRQQLAARQRRRRHGAGLRGSAADLARAAAPHAAPPAAHHGRHLRVPVRGRVAVRVRDDQPRAVRGHRVHGDVRVVGRLHALPVAAPRNSQRAGRSRRARRDAGAVADPFAPASPGGASSGDASPAVPSGDSPLRCARRSRAPSTRL